MKRKNSYETERILPTNLMKVTQYLTEFKEKGNQ